MTPTGRETGESLFGDRVERAWLPYDLRFAVRRFLAHYQPRFGMILETEVWPRLLEECASEGVPVVLANGRLGPRGDAGRDGPLALLARDLHVGPDAVAIAAALARPWADVVLLGAVTVEQLRSNLRALEVRPGPALLARVESLRRDPAAYWRERGALVWT